MTRKKGKKLVGSTKKEKNISQSPNSTSEEKKAQIYYVSTLNPDANKHLKHYKPPNDRPVRIYCDGIYDLFHYGHARSLEQVKKLFPNVYLLVGCCNDELTHSLKGRTVMTDQERYESLRHCKWVDEVVEDAPWTIDHDFIEKHKIDFVAHDDIPYQSVTSDDVYKFVKDQGKFIATQRTAGISTSDLITRIVRDYDSYVRRNIQRGATPRDLNLSLLKQGEMKMEEFKGKIQKRFREQEQAVVNNWEMSRDELVNMLQKWESKSQELIRGFTERFDVRALFKNASPSKRKSIDGLVASKPSLRKKLMEAITGVN